MGESIVHRTMRLLARSHALEPVRHVPKRQVIDAHRRKLVFGLPGKQNILRSPGSVDIRVVFVRALFLDQLIPRAALASDVDERSLLTHVAGETGSVIAEAGRVADQKTFWILKKGLEGVGIFAAIMPGENTAVSNYGPRKAVVHEPVHEIDPVAHPLIGDAARKFLIQAEFTINLGVEWAVWLIHKPLAPVGVLLANQFRFWASAPPRAVVVPDNFYFAYVAERPGLDQVMSRHRMRLAAVLGSDLHDPMVLHDRISCSFHFRENIAHWLLNVSVLTGFGCHLENGRVRVLRRRNDHRVDIFGGEHILHVLEGSRLTAVVLCVFGDRFVAPESP